MAHVIRAFGRVVPMCFPEIEEEILDKFDANIFQKSQEHQLAITALKGQLMKVLKWNFSYFNIKTKVLAMSN